MKNVVFTNFPEGNNNLLPGKIIEGKLQLLGQSFPLPPTNWKGGIEVMCAIRPERVQIGSLNDSLIPATIQDITYFGAVVRYKVFVKSSDPGNTSLNIKIPSPQAIYKQNDQIGIVWRFEDIHLFPNKKKS